MNCLLNCLIINNINAWDKVSIFQTQFVFILLQIYEMTDEKNNLSFRGLKNTIIPSE